MEAYKEEFIRFMVDSGVLKFGDFVTKSGRNTPFFINTGFYRTGRQLQKLGEYYARAIHDAFGDDFDVLFGPAYKGIPLSVSTVMAYYSLYGKEIRYACNRKEIKDHGDKGILLGGPIGDGDRIVIVEDVTTAGTSIRETMPIIRERGKVKVLGLCVSVDREERGQGERSALSEIEEEYGFKAASIVGIGETVQFLKENPIDGKILIDGELDKKIEEYFEKYGAGGKKHG